LCYGAEYDHEAITDPLHIIAMEQLDLYLRRSLSIRKLLIWRNAVSGNAVESSFSAMTILNAPTRTGQYSLAFRVSGAVFHGGTKSLIIS
jgi:hypothetical protein